MKDCDHGVPVDGLCYQCVAEDITTPPIPPSHRFTDWQPGRYYAFARGLNISPQHLAVALDAMEDEGWTLMAIFGQSQADRIGFIFRRK